MKYFVVMLSYSNNSIQEMSILQKLKHFSSFESANCDSNFSFKWRKIEKNIQQDKG